MLILVFRHKTSIACILIDIQYLPKSSVLIYKQTILPLIYYAGFRLIACNIEQKENFPKLQNDILRVCCIDSLIEFVLNVYIRNVQ